MRTKLGIDSPSSGSEANGGGGTKGPVPTCSQVVLMLEGSPNFSSLEK